MQTQEAALKAGRWVTIALLISFYVIAFVFYPQMPARMASHWDSSGVVDGYTSRFLGLFLLPFIATAVTALFLAIPVIDPLKANIAKFRLYFDWFVVLFLAFFEYLYILTILWNKNVSFDFTQALLPAVGVLFVYIGIMLRNARRNYMIGIRTPWTLANEEVWNRTHSLGGKLFIAAGIVSAFGAVWPKYAIFFILSPVLVVTLITVVYSYAIYPQSTRSG
jgi:uncharacterized membrane protein